MARNKKKNNRLLILNIILAAPNTASTSLVDVINKNSNFDCHQIMAYPSLSSIIQKKDFYYSLKKLKINKCLEMFIGYYFRQLTSRYLNTNRLSLINPAIDYQILSNYHSDICDFNVRLFGEFEKFIFKHKNLILKQHFPPTKNNLKFFKNFKKIILVRNTDDIIKKYSLKNPEKFQLINKDDLKIEINNWKNKWMSEKNTLIVQFDKLVTYPYEQLKLIEEYTDIKFNISEKFALPHLNKTKSED